MKINDIGLLLIMAINNNILLNKNKLILSIENYNKSEKEKENNEIKKKEFYQITYEQKREEDKIIYNEYINNRLLLYNKWQKTRNIEDLENLINYKLPPLNLVNDIYTSDLKKSKLK
jgi:hypothetical protein